MAARFDPRPAALALAEAFREGQPIGELPADAAPRTRPQGERVVAEVLAELELAAVGFRALPGGLVGPLLESRLLPSGVSVPASALPGGEARPALLALLHRKLPARATAYSPRLVLGAVVAWRAAIDLTASRLRQGAPTAAIMTADLSGLGQVVVAAPGRGVPDPAALRVSWNQAPPVTLDATPLLLAAAEAARQAGGLPAGAALLAVLDLPAVPVAAGIAPAVRIVSAGRAEAALV